MDNTRPPDYRRNLPHYTPNDAPYFVTFNLADAIPERILMKLRNKTAKFSEYDSHLHTTTIGEHWLRDERVAQATMHKLTALVDSVLEVYVFTIMSNHVHLLMSLREKQLLKDVMKKLKGASARECNLLLNRTGAFWQHESYDRVLRRNEYWPVVRYIVNNPVKAKVVDHWKAYPWTWINPGLYTGDEFE
jgi:putative transposase